MDLKSQDDGIMNSMRIKQQFQHSKLVFSNSRLSLSNSHSQIFPGFQLNQDKPKLFLQENLGMKMEFGSKNSNSPEFDSQNSNSKVPEGIWLPEFQLHGAKEGFWLPNPRLWGIFFSSPLDLWIFLLFASFLVLPTLWEYSTAHGIIMEWLGWKGTSR